VLFIFYFITLPGRAFPLGVMTRNSFLSMFIAPFKANFSGFFSFVEYSPCS